MDAESQTGAEDIQNQVVDVAASHQGEELRDLHGGDDRGGGQQHPGQGVAFGKDPGQQKAKGDEHDDVAAQIDDGGPDKFRAGRVQQLCEKPQGPEGNEIYLPGHLLPVGDPLYGAGPVKKQPQHPGAIGQKQRGMDSSVAHGFPSFRFPALYQTRREKTIEKSLDKWGLIT